MSKHDEAVRSVLQPGERPFANGWFQTPALHGTDVLLVFTDRHLHVVTMSKRLNHMSTRSISLSEISQVRRTQTRYSRGRMATGIEIGTRGGAELTQYVSTEADDGAIGIVVDRLSAVIAGEDDQSAAPPAASDDERFCSRCGGRLDQESRGCRSCGFARSAGQDELSSKPVSATSPVAVSSGTPRKRIGCGGQFLIWLGLILAIVLVAIAVGAGGSDDGGTNASEEAEVSAFEVCKEFVKDRLKSPGSATFRNYFEADGEVAVTKTGEGIYVVRSSVDSENGFGAELRTNFTCQVRSAGEGQWNLVDLAMG